MNYQENKYESGTSARREAEEKRILSGIFYSREDAENAYRSLKERGYTEDEINVMMTDSTRTNWYGDDTDVEIEEGSKALEGTGVGSAVGGTLGAIIGGIAAIGSNVFIPGAGLVIAGPIVAAFAGAGAGGLTGGLVGGLVGAGMTEKQATLYEEGLKKDSAVFAVEPRNEEDVDHIKDRWSSHRGENIYY
jgi:hypothetical protein